MFTPSLRRHPLQSFPFWFLVLSGVVLVAAWKFQFFSFQGSAEDSFVPVTDDKPTESAETSNPKALANWAAEAESATIAALAPAGNAESPSTSEWAQPDPGPKEGARAVVQASGSDAGQNEITSALHQSSGNKVAQAGPAQSAAVPQPTPTEPGDIAAEIAEAAQLLKSGDDVAAHRILSTLYWQHPQSRGQFQNQIDAVAHRIYFEPQPHYITEHTVQPGELLQHIGRSYQVSWEYLAKLNRIDPNKLQAGQSLKVIQGPFNAVVDLGRFELIVHAYGYYVAKFPIGIGQDGATPIGTFYVTDKVIDPTYYGPDGVIEHDDPHNPLGERWIAINDDSGTANGYGIHGTIDPNSIGKAESKGCLRLRDTDINALYDLLTVGSELVIRR